MAKKKQIPAQDDALAEHKRAVRLQSDAAVRTGRLQQSDVFMVRPELARRATVTLKR